MVILYALWYLVMKARSPFIRTKEGSLFYIMYTCIPLMPHSDYPRACTWAILFFSDYWYHPHTWIVIYTLSYSTSIWSIPRYSGIVVINMALNAELWSFCPMSWEYIPWDEKSSHQRKGCLLWLLNKVYGQRLCNYCMSSHIKRPFIAVSYKS